MAIISLFFSFPVEILLRLGANFIVVIFFISLYLWLRNVLKTKTSILIVFILLYVLCFMFVEFINPSVKMIHDGYHRLCWTLPEEYCLWAVFVSPVLIKKILLSNEKMTSKSNIKRIVLFGLTVAATLVTHYYTTIFQFVTCSITFLFYINRLNRYKFLSFLISTAAASVIGFIPYFLSTIFTRKVTYALT